MRYFSIPLELEATIFIQARSPLEAQSKLDAVLSKTIDAGDLHWFTNGPLGSRYLPELAFGSEMRVCHSQPNGSFQQVESYDLWHLMRPREENAKRRVLPTSRNWYGEGKLPKYSANILLRTACYVKAETLEAAHIFVEHFKGKRLNRYHDYSIFQDESFLGPSQIVLSPDMLVVRVLKSVVSGRDKLELIYMGDPAATVANLPASMGARENEVHEVAADVRGMLWHLERGFDMMADHHAHEIASMLIDYRNKTIGKPAVDDCDY